ncbi:MAG: hypothetical protein MZW92_81425 [Comamonadaceae bacterium]|nr:hypothetical protein [Comamonadaceae bacterium]
MTGADGQGDAGAGERGAQAREPFGGRADRRVSRRDPRDPGRARSSRSPPPRRPRPANGRSDIPARRAAARARHRPRYGRTRPAAVPPAGASARIRPSPRRRPEWRRRADRG